MNKKLKSLQNLAVVLLVVTLCCGVQDSHAAVSTLVHLFLRGETFQL